MIILIIIIKVTIVAYYIKWLSWTFPAPNTSTSLQTLTIIIILIIIIIRLYSRCAPRPVISVRNIKTQKDGDSGLNYAMLLSIFTENIWQYSSSSLHFPYQPLSRLLGGAVADTFALHTSLLLGPLVCDGVPSGRLIKCFWLKLARLIR
jgi:hypothetical protein